MRIVVQNILKLRPLILKLLSIVVAILRKRLCAVWYITFLSKMKTTMIDPQAANSDSRAATGAVVGQGRKYEDP